MKEQTDQSKIMELHECNAEIYKIIGHLKEIGADNMGLAFQNLRNATGEIQKAIAAQIDKITNTEKP